MSACFEIWPINVVLSLQSNSNRNFFCRKFEINFDRLNFRAISQRNQREIVKEEFGTFQKPSCFGLITNEWRDTQVKADFNELRIMAPSLGVNLRVTGHCNQGGRKYMEDIFSVAYQQTDDEKDLEYAFFGIFDGHGGREAAQFAKVKPNILEKLYVLQKRNFL